MRVWDLFCHIHPRTDNAGQGWLHAQARWLNLPRVHIFALRCFVRDLMPGTVPSQGPSVVPAVVPTVLYLHHPEAELLSCPLAQASAFLLDDLWSQQDSSSHGWCELSTSRLSLSSGTVQHCCLQVTENLAMKPPSSPSSCWAVGVGRNLQLS